ncbi:MAG: NRAMP family divalent metal transporter [Gemmatimonadota bacterium]
MAGRTGQRPRAETLPGGAPSDFWKSFGPGLLWAAAAIGVSHLVQSTRAGADAGFALTGVVLLALVLKYPFFEYGPRYAAATGESLVEGYRRIGRWALWTYFGITVATAVVIASAIVVFTGFLAIYVLGLDWPIPIAGGLIFLVCGVMLRIGRFRLLDRAIKAVLVALAVSTVIAALIALPHADFSTFALWPGDALDFTTFAFILALVGWMPSAIDIAVWSSLWTLAKDDDAGQRTSVAHARFDFVVGYVGTGLMALAFLTLGAAVMHGAGESFSAQGTAFSVQLVDLYGETLPLGGWARPLVAVAVLTTMFSTALTVIDGFPRAIARSIRGLQGPEPARLPPAGRRADATAAAAVMAVAADGATGADADDARLHPTPTADPADRGTAQDEDPLYWIALVAMGVLTTLVLALFVGSLTGMVDFATIVSFLTAPVLGYLNLRAVTADEVPPEHRPGRAMRVLSYVGLFLLGGTGVVYLLTLVA